MDPVSVTGCFIAALVSAWLSAPAPDLDVPVALPEGDLTAGQVVEKLAVSLESPYAVAKGAEALLAAPAEMSGRILSARRIILELAETGGILAWRDGRALVCFDRLHAPALLEADSRWTTAADPARKAASRPVFVKIPAGRVLASESHLSIPAARRNGRPGETRSWSWDRTEAKRLCVEEREEHGPRSTPDANSVGEKIEP